MAISTTIGPSGQPPTTSYTYDLGVVTLSARPATVRAASELASIVKSIRLFKQLVVNNDPPVIVAPTPPLIYRWVVEEEMPGIATCRFRAGGANGSPNFTVDATQDLATRITSFEARPQRSIIWGDFDLFFRWMVLLADLAQR